jgi:hypothetical protein
LVDLFSDEAQSGAAQRVGGNSVQNLPGTPSPVTNPASQGEAVIERTTANAAPAEVSPIKSRAKESRVQVRLSPSQQVYLHASKAWIPPESISGCHSLVSEYQLYNIQCLGLVSSLDDEYYRGHHYQTRK